MAAKTEKPDQPEVVRPFSHGDKPVFVLIPDNSKDNKSCQEEIEKIVGDGPKPNITSALPVLGISTDAVVYVMHPYKRKERTVKGQPRFVNAIHLSRPIEVGKEALRGNKQGYKTIDSDKLQQTVTKVCDHSNPAGKFFRGQLLGEDPKAPEALILRLSEM